MLIVMGWRELFQTTFELLYHRHNRLTTCAKHLSPDLIDGKEYTIEEFYSACRPFFDRPCDFFRDFAYPDAPNLRPAWENSEVKAGAFQLMEFDSPIKTDYPENNLVPFKWFRSPAERAKVMLLFVPGWGRTSQSHEEKMCMRLATHGIDSGLLTKPYHQKRTPAGSFDGEYFISSNLYWTISNFRQFTAEIRLLIQYMRSRYDYVGLIGMSSGGFQAGLAANCEDLDFLFPFNTGCQLGSITWHGLKTQVVRAECEARGISEDDLNHVWAITDLAVNGKHCKARFRKQYMTLYDRIIPYEYQLKLWEVYGRPERWEIKASHYGCFFYFNAIMDDIAEFIHRCLIGKQ